MSTESRTGNGGALRNPENGGELGRVTENLSRSNVEFRFADLENEKVVAAIAVIFGQKSTIEHLSGIAPTQTPKKIDRFRRRLPELMPNINIDPSEVFTATTREIGAYFRAKDQSKTRVIIAQSTGPNPEILGTITVEKPVGADTYVLVSKLAVSEKAREKGVGDGLIKSANALALCKVEEGGWGYSGATATIIQVRGGEKAQLAFKKNGYDLQGTRPNGTTSWDNNIGEFVPRDRVLIQLDGSHYKPDLAYLPKAA